MTPVLDFIFEFILSPNEKIENGKGKLKKIDTAVRTADNLMKKKFPSIEQCYKDAKANANEDVEKAFKGVKMPW